MSPNEAPPEGLYGRESDPEAENASGVLGGETGPQAGAEGFDGVEIHHWDAEKTAEVARLLAEHPPRDCTITTTVGQTGQADETPPAVHPRARCRCGHARDLHNDTDCAGCTHAGLNHLARHAFIAREDQLCPPYRILVTGSRNWADTDTVCEALDAAVGNAVARGREPVLVVGDCPTGADRIAYRWATAAMVPTDVHIAKWRQYGNAAGPRRNIAMVKSGADEALAFIGPCTSLRCRRRAPHLSHGASGCAAFAEAVGIPTQRFTA